MSDAQRLTLIGGALMSVRVRTLAVATALGGLSALFHPPHVMAQAPETSQFAPDLQALVDRAEQGDPAAQYSLGVAYDTGQGAPRNYALAAAWYQKAAEGGFARAQYNLAGMYADGQGVTQDFGQAVLWYTKASDQGDPMAQFNLALLYNNGQGAIKDQAEALKWLDLAASRATGDERALFAKARDTLTAQLSAPQIADAKQRARSWQQAFEQRKP